MSANTLTQAILTQINYTQGCYAWRQNNNPTPVRKDGKVVAFRKGSVEPGVSDILGCCHGQFFGFEVKQKDKQSEDQKGFEDKVRAAGGYYHIFRDIDSFIKYWGSFEKGLR